MYSAVAPQLYSNVSFFPRMQILQVVPQSLKPNSRKHEIYIFHKLT